LAVMNVAMPHPSGAATFAMRLNTALRHVLAHAGSPSIVTFSALTLLESPGCRSPP